MIEKNGTTDCAVLSCDVISWTYSPKHSLNILFLGNYFFINHLKFQWVKLQDIIA